MSATKIFAHASITATPMSADRESDFESGGGEEFSIGQPPKDGRPRAACYSRGIFASQSGSRPRGIAWALLALVPILIRKHLLSDVLEDRLNL